MKYMKYMKYEENTFFSQIPLFGGIICIADVTLCVIGGNYEKNIFLPFTHGNCFFRICAIS